MEEDEEQTTENKKECLFSFAIINKYFIFPFLCPIFCMLTNSSYLLVDGDINDEKKHNFLNCMLQFLSYLPGGLLYFVTFIRTKTNETRNKAIINIESSPNNIKYIYNAVELKKNECKIIGYLIIMSIIYSFAYLSLMFRSKNEFEYRMYFFIFLPLLSKYILKIDIFSHQILSLIISIIGMILLFIPTLTKIGTDDILYNVLLFFRTISQSLNLVLIKLITQNYYLSPYLCLLYLGIFSSFFTFIGYLIYSLIKEGNLSIITNSFNFSEMNGLLVLIIVGIFFFVTLYNILTILTIFYFSPNLLMVTDIISPILFWILLIIKGEKEESYVIILNIIGFMIALFSSLLYNEIIVLNFCGFNKNTKKCLEERQRQELIKLKETEKLTQSGSYENHDDASDDSN